MSFTSSGWGAEASIVNRVRKVKKAPLLTVEHTVFFCKLRYAGTGHALDAVFENRLVHEVALHEVALRLTSEQDNTLTTTTPCSHLQTECCSAGAEKASSV